jgi:hypothetical protein
VDKLQIRDGTMIKRTLKPTTRWAVLVAAVVTAGAIATGLAFGLAANPRANGTPNTFGMGASARSITGTPIAETSLSTTARDALATAGARNPARIASVGSGSQQAVLLQVNNAAGDSCLTVSHFGGKVVEPLNCHGDAYLRTWTDASGSGEIGPTGIGSVRTITAVAADVRTLRVSFADGSSRLIAPDRNGVVTLVSAAAPTNVEALGTDGSVLVTSQP